MEPQIYTIGLVVLFTLILIFAVFRKKVMGFIVQVGIGVLGIVGINTLVPTSCIVGINLMTIAVVAILGLPGIGLLYIFRIFL